MTLSPNVIIKSIDSNTVRAIQTQDGFDYTQILKIRNEVNLNFCVATDKFFSIMDEGIISIEQEPTTVTIHTESGEYHLPVLRERGLFMACPETTVPSTEDPEELVESWEDDYSSKSINTKTAANALSANSKCIVIGPSFVARGLNEILEVYGNADNAKISITPTQYGLLQGMGKVKIYLFRGGQFLAEGEDTVLRISRTAGKIDIKAVESRLVAGETLFTADLSGVNLKVFNKFVLEKVYVSFGYQ